MMAANANSSAEGSGTMLSHVAAEMVTRPTWFGVSTPLVGESLLTEAIVGSLDVQTTSERRLSELPSS